MELQIPYRLHTQIPQTDYLQADFSGYRSDYQNIMRPKRDRDHRSSGASGSYLNNTRSGNSPVTKVNSQAWLSLMGEFPAPMNHDCGERYGNRSFCVIVGKIKTQGAEAPCAPAIAVTRPIMTCTKRQVGCRSQPLLLPASAHGQSQGGRSANRQGSLTSQFKNVGPKGRTTHQAGKIKASALILQYLPPRITHPW